MHSIDSQKITEGRVSISENLEPIKEPNNGRDCSRGFKDSGHAAIQTNWWGRNQAFQHGLLHLHRTWGFGAVRWLGAEGPEAPGDYWFRPKIPKGNYFSRLYSLETFLV